MGFEKKEWKDRITEYPTRRNLVKEDGSIETVTVERNEGNVSQEGDALSKENMNNLEQRIADAIGEGDIPEGLGADIIAALTALNTGLTSVNTALGGLKLVVLTQAQYNSLSPKDPNTLYFLFG